MKKIYEDMWKLAKSYYKRGRPMDIEHIEWMMKDALKVCEKENMDDSLLLPLVILHDVGYAEVSRGNPFNLDIRRAHMKAGAKVAELILTKLKYPREKIKKITYYVSVHDNWALGDSEIYKKDLLLGAFNDLDFMWMATSKGFIAVKKILNKTNKEMVDYLKNDSKLVNRPFCTKTTKGLFEKYMKKLK